MKGTFEERFWAKVETTDECWVWTAAKLPAGYGRFSLAPGDTRYAHRAVFTVLGLPEPGPSELVCHHCDNPSCVNPAHLFFGSDADNYRDMVAKGRSRQGVRQAERTSCPSGHPYDEQNTRVYHGHRSCRACDRTRMAQKRRAS